MRYIRPFTSLMEFGTFHAFGDRAVHLLTAVSCENLPGAIHTFYSGALTVRVCGHLAGSPPSPPARLTQDSHGYTTLTNAEEGTHPHTIAARARLAERARAARHKAVPSKKGGGLVIVQKATGGDRAS